MEDLNGFLNSLEARLSKDGFSVSRDVMTDPQFVTRTEAFPQFKLEVVARRTQLSVLRNSWTHVIAITTFDNASLDVVKSFSDYGWAFAIANKSKLVQASPNQVPRVRIVAIPVIVSGNYPEDVRNWIINTSPPHHGGDQFQFPVLIALAEKKIYYSEKSSLFGRAYIKGIRELVDKHLSFERSAQ